MHRAWLRRGGPHGPDPRYPATSSTVAPPVMAPVVEPAPVPDGIVPKKDSLKVVPGELLFGFEPAMREQAVTVEHAEIAPLFGFEPARREQAPPVTDDDDHASKLRAEVVRFKIARQVSAEIARQVGESTVAAPPQIASDGEEMSVLTGSDDVVPVSDGE